MTKKLNISIVKTSDIYFAVRLTSGFRELIAGVIIDLSSYALDIGKHLASMSSSSSSLLLALLYYLLSYFFTFI